MTGVLGWVLKKVRRTAMPDFGGITRLASGSLQGSIGSGLGRIRNSFRDSFDRISSGAGDLASRALPELPQMPTPSATGNSPMSSRSAMSDTFGGQGFFGYTEEVDFPDPPDYSM